MFTAQHLSERLREEPFRPFRLITSTGRSFVVRHPELMMVARHHIHVGKPSREPGVADSISAVAIIHITELEDLSPEPYSRAEGE